MGPDVCFVLMPFSEDFSGVFGEIQRAVEFANCECLRGDQIHSSEVITEDIIAKIRDARLLIADLTGYNPNVFYELGYAHALKKKVVLLLQEGCAAPFDLWNIRCIKYRPTDLAPLYGELCRFIKNSLKYPPDKRNSSFAPGSPAVRITHFACPEVATINKPFEITVHARNFGVYADEAYFSLSFPSGVADVSIVDSDVEKKVGRMGEKWRRQEIILKYPIAEGSVCTRTSKKGWPSQVSHSLTVKVTPTRLGLLQVYMAASSRVGDKPFLWDPESELLLDQREEPVYCDVIEIKQ